VYLADTFEFTSTVVKRSLYRSWQTGVGGRRNCCCEVWVSSVGP